MGVPTDRRYLPSHEWHKLEGNICTIGITKFAADELTDITYVSLPAVGTEVKAGKPFGEIESVKATSDLVCGVTGVVTEVNKKLSDAPELVNNDSFSQGWMIKVKVSDPGTFEKLMTAQAYEAQLGH
ncbi:MAG TPA: glycine cleavage system protein GcvH [Phycisphaerae bacterium]|nr:glycine cleavage system protein GcvH [Phycisphaerae bacterium]